MRAAVCRAHGPPDVVRVEDLPAPPLGPGQVRVRVHAAAVNFPDVLVVADRYQLTAPLPFVPGSELAGVVTEVAPDVSSVDVGARVAGTAFVGAFAEEAVIGAAAVTALPPSTDFRAGAASGVAHRTAFHVLRSVAELRPGEELVVLGAGGGVGLAAVQIGRQLGAVVTAVASTDDKLAVARDCGATRLVKHRAADLRAALREQLPAGTDVVVDPVGGSLAEPALRSLRPGGRYVTVGYASGEIPRIPLNLVLLKGIEIRGFQFADFTARRPEEFERNEQELRALVASGRVAPHVGAVFPLSEVVAALELVASGRAIGKVVLDLDTEEGGP
ncbi:MAG TPA: NADPH:quinone oxidoreductase family protein [Acidimicrobiales bacterium]|jgi:NADPH:quinone reductase-like Zn-dependent oxidoreductase|nr:NADPH:quinone oxidoreductase family protein [Acidimicrobiales bacterium]